MSEEREERDEPEAGAGPAGVRLELVVSRVLRIGVAVSATLLVVGLVLATARGQLDGLREAWSAGTVPAVAASPAALADGVAHLRADAVLLLGLVVLVLTPTVRVVASLVAYGRDRDWTYVALTATVLVLLGVSVLTGSA